MSLFDIILLGIALGIDCLVVSFSQGLIFSEQRLKNSFMLAATMGLFQGIMPVIGYVGAGTLYGYVVKYSNIIAFSIFLILGVKFILEAFQPKDRGQVCFDLACLTGLGIATSIDALISGASVRLTNTNLVMSCIIIGIISFIMSMSGFWSGNKFQRFNSKYLEIFGGIILIVLAIKAW